MAIIFLGARGGDSARAFDADTLAWEAQALVNGATVSLARRIIIDNFIYAEKSAGLWALTDDYLILWAENEPQALTSIKQRRLATAINSPTFTTDRDYAFDGLSNYIDTNFVPNSHTTTMSVNSAHLESYERTNVSGNSPIGVSSGGSIQINVQPRSGANALVSVMGGNATYTLPSATSIGLTQSGRNGATLNDNYAAKNGADMIRTVTYASLAASLPTHSFYIGGVNTSGVLTQAKAASVGYVSYGSKLDSTQRAARFINVDALRTAVGA